MIGLDAGMSGIIYDTASVSSMHAIAAARNQAIEVRLAICAILQGPGRIAYANSENRTNHKACSENRRLNG
jgi:hypothetical protein